MIVEKKSQKLFLFNSLVRQNNFFNLIKFIILQIKLINKKKLE